MEDLHSTRHVLEGRELIGYLVERAAQEAKTALMELEERRKRRVSVMLSLVALVGVSSIISALKVFVRSEMDVVSAQSRDAATALEKRLEKKTVELQNQLQAKVEQVVLGQIDVKIGEVQKKLDDNETFERYIDIATRLPEKLARVARRDERYVIETLRDALLVAEKVAAMPNIARRPRFVGATRQIVEVMTRFSSESEIDRLDDLLGEIMATDEEMARCLVDHYGQLIIGSAQTVEAQPDNVRRLNRYIRATRELNYPERALLWTIFVEFKRNSYTTNATIQRLLESTLDLTAANQKEFWFQMYRYTASTNWLFSADQQGRELERLTAALFKQYPEVERVVAKTMSDNHELYARLPAGAQRPSTPAMAPPATDAAEEPEETETAQTADADNTLRQ